MQNGGADATSRELSFLSMWRVHLSMKNKNYGEGVCEEMKIKAE
jgi:hypothetical protein